MADKTGEARGAKVKAVGGRAATTPTVRRIVSPSPKRKAESAPGAARPAAKDKAGPSAARPATKDKAEPTGKAAGAPPKKPMAPPLASLDRLREIHPDAHCELDHDGAFQLLVATVLSAQTTDVNVNKATPKLFARFPDPGALAAADPKDVEPYVSTLGFFRQKAKNLVGLAKKLVDEHGGNVPQRLDRLVELPGVGRKTANVVLGVIWNTPEGVVVDTHVQRISQRLGWTKNPDPASIERDLMQLIPRDHWDETAHLLIFHGRRICFARKPNCAGCGLNDICPSAFHAENVGRKPKRARATG